MSYAATRRLVLAAGLTVLLLVAGVMYLRRVDTVEVVAVLLFIVVFLGFVLAGLRGGVVAAVVATGAYAFLRSPAVDALGSGRYTTLVLSRGLGYLAFGLLGGWASRELLRSLDKLDVYDQIDDETGLYNARFLVEATGLEMARAGRYKTIFSVCVADVDAGPLDALPRRRRAAVLKDLGRRLGQSVRTVDRAVHARDGALHRFAVICPETGSEGAAVFVGRLADSLATALGAAGVPVEAAAVARHRCTFPGDEEAMTALREEFAAVDRVEHPGEARPAAAPAAPAPPGRPVS
ncbi:MAG TPA: hypothetical protein VFO65_06450 [Acidimicrobiales bacterium]|nr:hypothetical protein [Acidimicrobiales bacterium]